MEFWDQPCQDMQVKESLRGGLMDRFDSRYVQTLLAHVVNRNRFRDAVNAAVAALPGFPRSFNVYLPAHPSWEEKQNKIKNDLYR